VENICQIMWPSVYVPSLLEVNVLVFWPDARPTMIPMSWILVVFTCSLDFLGNGDGGPNGKMCKASMQILLRAK